MAQPVAQDIVISYQRQTQFVNFHRTVVFTAHDALLNVKR